VLNGVRVVRPWATSLGKRTRAHRMADYLTFWTTSVLECARVEAPDVILVLTTPPMIALGGALVAALRRVPLVSWVQDVYPEIAAEFGVLSETSPVYRGLSAAARVTHRSTRRIVALSEGMARRLELQGAPRERLRVVQNWSDGSLIHPVAHADNPFRRTHGLEDAFVLMYSGNLGVGHDVATFVDAAKLLATTEPRARLVFVGEGGRRAEAEQLARGLPNVTFPNRSRTSPSVCRPPTRI
jgi:glycosyltransferase involved in cell wall biosynthesis